MRKRLRRALRRCSGSTLRWALLGCVLAGRVDEWISGPWVERCDICPQRMIDAMRSAHWGAADSRGAMLVAVAVAFASVAVGRAGRLTLGATLLAGMYLCVSRANGLRTNCWGPITEIEASLDAFAIGLPFRAFGSACVAWLLWSFRTRGGVAMRATWIASALFLLERACADGFGAAASIALRAGARSAPRFDALRWSADAADVLLLGAAGAALGVALAASGLRSRRDAVRFARTAPVIGALWAMPMTLSDPLVTITTVQEQADPIWREVPGFERPPAQPDAPVRGFLFTRSRSSIGLVRPPGGPTLAFSDGRRWAMRDDDTLEPRRLFWVGAAEVLFDARASEQDRAVVMRQTRELEDTCVLGFANDLEAAADATRRRWPLVDRVGRSLRMVCGGRTGAVAGGPSPGRRIGVEGELRAPASERAMVRAIEGTPRAAAVLAALGACAGVILGRRVRSPGARWPALRVLGMLARSACLCVVAVSVALALPVVVVLLR